MGIQSKIEEIRRQPEHIRMRYVLGSVCVSMLIISILWIFSITTSLRSEKENNPLPLETKGEVNQSAPDVNVPQSDAAPSLNEWIKK